MSVGRQSEKINGNEKKIAQAKEEECIKQADKRELLSRQFFSVFFLLFLLSLNVKIHTRTDDRGADKQTASQSPSLIME